MGKRGREGLRVVAGLWGALAVGLALTAWRRPASFASEFAAELWLVAILLLWCIAIHVAIPHLPQSRRGGKRDWLAEAVVLAMVPVFALLMALMFWQRP